MARNTVRVVARLQARPETVEAMRSVLTGLIEPTRNEPGCITYELLQQTGDPTDFTFVEEWETNETLDAHLASPHLAKALAILPNMLADEPDIRRYELIG